MVVVKIVFVWLVPSFLWCSVKTANLVLHCFLYRHQEVGASVSNDRLLLEECPVIHKDGRRSRDYRPCSCEYTFGVAFNRTNLLDTGGWKIGLPSASTPQQSRSYL